MFSYFTETIVLIFLGYAMVYPFFFWITPLQKIDLGFYRFNLGKCCVVGALGVLSLNLLNVDPTAKLLIYTWIILLLLITALYWNAERINNIVVSSISIFGCAAMTHILIGIAPQLNQKGFLFISFLGSAITAGVFFAMILGHWYLNVVALPINLLKKATMVLWSLLGIRTIWDMIYMKIDSVVDQYGIYHSIWAFMLKFDGFLLAVAFFMGNLVPIILNYFIWRTLKLQATQSATGLLYVSVVSILFGDLLFKYYLIQFGFLV